MSKKSGSYHHGDLSAALLAETAAMIAEGGVDSVTMRELSRRLGVSRAAPYRHYPDKSTLLVAVGTAGFGQLANRLRSTAADEPRAGIERIRRMGEEYVRFAIDNPSHYRLMYGKEALTREDLPELREAADTLFSLLVDVIRAQQRSGGIKRGDPEVLAYVAWSAVHGLSSLLIERQIVAAIDVDVLIRQTTRTLLDGLRVRPRSDA